MEVTNARDFVTHAVVGGMAAEAVGMDDSPEFMHVLSSTLYKDKPLAVVREVLCNAWDAHIEAGIMSIAVEVTLTPEKFIIRDFGEGIAREHIRTIYGIYGRSTKKKNKLVTGGFGLGSKSPWAYTDHFQVASHHQGEKTIYNMSKSSAQVQGKPMITPLVTVPTDESGLEVSINIKSRNDYHLFMNLVTRIAALGEMKVKLNGTLLKVVPFSKAEDGYLLVKKDILGDNRHSIFVRYGHVVYPVDDGELYESEMGKVTRFLNKFDNVNNWNNDGQKWAVVLFADASTLSITPSRESLSMTDESSKVIKALLKNFLGKIEGKIEKIVFPLNSQMIHSLAPMSPPSKLLNTKAELVDQAALPGKLDRPYIANVEELGATYMRRQYPDFPGFRVADLKERLDVLIDSQFGDTQLLRSYRRELQRSWINKHPVRAKETKRKFKNKTWNYDRRSNFVHRRILWPVLREFQRAGLQNRIPNLFVFEGTKYSRKPAIRPGAQRGAYGNWAQLTLFKHFGQPTLLETMPFLRKIAIVAYNRADIEDRAKNFPMVKHWFGDPKMSVACVIPRNNKKQTAQDAIAVFEKLGFIVLDLTRFHSWETHLQEEFEEKITERKAKAKPKPKKRLSGYPKLSQVLSLSRQSLDVARLYSDEAERLDKPEFIVLIPYRESGLEHIDGWDYGASCAIARLFGDRGVVVRSVVQQAKVQSLHPDAKPLLPWVLDQVLVAYQTNPKIEQYYRNSTQYSPIETEATKQIIRMIRRDDKLRKKFKLPAAPNEQTRDAIKIFESKNNRYSSHLAIQEIQKIIKPWKYSPELEAVLRIVRGNTLTELVDLDNIEQALKLDIESARKTTAREIFLLSLKG